jgi:hypothetical protein
MHLDRIVGALSGAFSALSVVLAVATPSGGLKVLAIVSAVLFGVVCGGIIVWEVQASVRKPAARTRTNNPARYEPDEAGSSSRLTVRHSPKEILELYEGLTDVQGKKLIEPYLGKWLEVAGNVGDVHRFGDDYVVGFGYSREHPYNITMSFDGKAWGDRLSVLRINDSIRVRGQIGGVSRVTVVLSKCELSNED